MRATSGQLTPCLYSAAGKNSLLPMKGLGVTDKAIASPRQSGCRCGYSSSA